MQHFVGLNCIIVGETIMFKKSVLVIVFFATLLFLFSCQSNNPYNPLTGEELPGNSTGEEHPGRPANNYSSIVPASLFNNLDGLNLEVNELSESAKTEILES